MATSSFTKDFTLRTQEEVDSFIKILETPTEKIELTIEKISEDEQRKREEELFKLLSIKKNINF